MQELGGVGWVTDLSPGAGEVVLEAARDQRVHHLKGKGGGGGEGGVRGRGGGEREGERGGGERGGEGEREG